MRLRFWRWLLVTAWRRINAAETGPWWIQIDGEPYAIWGQYEQDLMEETWKTRTLPGRR